MKQLAIIFCLISLLGACVAREATYTDREFGMAQYSMQQQIVNPTPPVATTPEGVQPIDAEQMMDARNTTYNVPPAKVQYFSITTGK